MYNFASDNVAGAHELVLKAIVEANAGNAPPYGADEFSLELEKVFRRHFGENCSACPMFNGTGANFAALKVVADYRNGIICPDTSHINCDETGGPEAAVGVKLLLVKNDHGKVKPEDLKSWLEFQGNAHHAQAAALSIAQTTECGTAYSLAELAELAAVCKAGGLYFHMDGSRLANAAAHLGVSLKALTADVGVDVACFGGTKNGLLFGDAVLILNPDLAARLPFIRKQNGQLYSKMRFLAAQFITYLDSGLWLENAKKANAMASLMAAGLKESGKCEIAHEVQGNAVFVKMNRELCAHLQKSFLFNVLDEKTNLVRLMASFATKEEEVQALVEAVKKF